jgi:hypothetical protein
MLQANKNTYTFRLSPVGRNLRFKPVKLRSQNEILCEKKHLSALSHDDLEQQTFVRAYLVILSFRSALVRFVSVVPDSLSINSFRIESSADLMAARACTDATRKRV